MTAETRCAARNPDGGYGPDTPDWLAVWLLIIADNTMHLLINRFALRRFGGSDG